MDRYKSTKRVTELETGYKKLETKFYRKCPKSQNDIYVMSQYGDRFDKLAFEYYKDASLWWYIAKANNMAFNNIPEGELLRIPADISYAQ